MDGPGEDQGITYQDLLYYFETHGSSAEMKINADEDGVDGTCSRWKPFESFHRSMDQEVGGEVKLMTSDEGILRDLLPGSYSMKDIVHFPDLPSILPSMVRVKVLLLDPFLPHSMQGTRWEDGREGRPGRLIFPPGFSGKVPSEVLAEVKEEKRSCVQIASSQTLGYYGARLAESCPEARVSLQSRWTQTVRTSPYLSDTVWTTTPTTRTTCTRWARYSTTHSSLPVGGEKCRRTGAGVSCFRPPGLSSRQVARLSLEA